MIEAFQAGGPLMWPLALCSVGLIAFLFERAVAVPSSRWRQDPAVRSAHRPVRAIFTPKPPAIGLLGTVVGVVECFQLLDADSPGVGVAGGLGVACLTTVFGLSIALVAGIAGHALDALATVREGGAA